MGSKNKQNKKNNNKPTIVVAAASKPAVTTNKGAAAVAATTPTNLPDSPHNHGERPPGTALPNHNEIVVIEDEEAHHDEDAMAEMEMLPHAGSSNTSFDSSVTDAIKTRAEATLRTIEESLADIKSLLRTGEYISAREIALLRSSLVYLLGDHKKLASTELGQACLQDLHDVEFSVLGAQDAQTGDSESLTPLGFGDNMQPHLATTVNRLQAKREADLAAKKKKKEGKKSIPSTPVTKPNEGGAKKGDATTTKKSSVISSPITSPKVGPKNHNNTSAFVAANAKNNNKDNNKDSKDVKKGASPTTSNKPPAWKFVNIPPRRRLQTLVMSCMLFFTGVPAAIFTAVVLLMIPFTMPFMVAYIIYMIYSQLFLVRHPLKPYTGWTQSSFLQIYKDYFPCRLSIPRDYRPQFDRKRNYMFICHPHGVHSFGVVCCFGADVQGISNMIPGIKIHAQTLGINFWIPFWRQLTIWGGCGDASAGCIRKTLRSGPGESIALVVGGAAESLLSSPKTNILCLKNRMGFVKISLETGSPLVPVFSFGETNVYYNFAQGSPLLKKILVSIQKRIGFAIPLISGRGYFNYNFGILPHRRPIIVVVGEPLDMPQIPNPTREEVSHWHGKYIEALKAHYEKHKAVYDVEGTLEIE